MRRLDGFDRFRIASILRLVSALCLVLLAVTVVWQPLSRIVRPRIAPALQHMPLPELLRSSPDGFMVRIVSDPLGATVSIDGNPRGSTPLFANVACEPGEKIDIKVEKQGFPAYRRTVPCRLGEELTLQAKLGSR